MKYRFHLGNKSIVFALPLLCFLCLYLLPQSSFFQMHPKLLSIGISIDLLLTVPLLFFFLTKNTKIPKTLVVPVIVLGMFLGYAILPKENQQFLDYFKNWVLPFIELAVLSFVGYHMYSSVKQFKINKNSSLDFYTTLQASSKELFPKVPAALVASEFGVLYYGFLTWKKRPLKENEFSYHKDSGTLTVLVALMVIIGIETYVFHIILAKWNSILAWILTALSCYTAIQIFGFLKSMARRPIAIKDTILHLPYGIMGEAIIPLAKIGSIECNSKELEENKLHRKLSFLGVMESHNIILRVKEPLEVQGLYGISKKYEVLGFYVDGPTQFKKSVEQHIKDV